MKARKNIIKKNLSLFICFTIFLTIGNVLLKDAPESSPIPNISKSHQSLLLPIELKIPFTPYIQCLIIDKKTQSIISNAYLISKKTNEMDEFAISQKPMVEIAIPKENLHRVLSHSGEIIAIPKDTKIKKKEKYLKKGVSYQIIF